MASNPNAATLEANAGGLSLDGRIRQAGAKFVVEVDAREVARVGSLGAAAHRLAQELRHDLRGRDQSDWGVAVQCAAKPEIGLQFANRQQGGGGGHVDACVAEGIARYRQGKDNLERALETAAWLLAECCG